MYKLLLLLLLLLLPLSRPWASQGTLSLRAACSRSKLLLLLLLPLSRPWAS
jgi:hypothetical protein